MYIYIYIYTYIYYVHPLVIKLSNGKTLLKPINKKQRKCFKQPPGFRVWAEDAAPAQVNTWPIVFFWWLLYPNKTNSME